MRLHAARKNCGVFAAAEVQSLVNDRDAGSSATGRVENVNEFLIGREVNRFAHFAHFIGDAEAHCDAFADIGDLIDHVLVDFARFAAYFKLHDGFARNDVAAFAGDELTDVDAGHAAGVARDAHHLNRSVGSRRERIAAFLRAGAGMGWIIVLAIIVIISYVMLLVSITMPKFKKMQKLVDNINLVSREILTGLSVIRAFGREDKEEERFDTANRELTGTTLFTNRVMTFMMPGMMMIMNVLTVGIVWFGAHRIDEGTMQVGAMTAFITYAMMIVMSFLMLTMMSIMLPRAAVAAGRIDEVIRTELSIQDAKTPEKLDVHNGVVRFCHVNFRYPGAEEDVLHDIDFVAEPGKTTAIIGSTGCGKSTLVNLIPRLYDVTGGQITLDGKDIRNITMKELRDEIGFVPQKGVLFSGTIASNLRFGKENATDAEIEKAAAIAQATEFIEAKDDKYETAISQGGTNVSGGQKQRLAIARAIAKDPKIFIFDDSFSALDLKTDAALRKALAENVKDSTVIIVAQRISTILHAEQILVLDDGKVVGKGTHEELLKNCKVYQEIAKSQLSAKELGIESEVADHE